MKTIISKADMYTIALFLREDFPQRIASRNNIYRESQFRSPENMLKRQRHQIPSYVVNTAFMS